MEVFKIQKNGCLRRRGESYFVSGSLRGHRVGLERIDELRARVWFYDLDLCILEIAPDVSPAVFNSVQSNQEIESA